MTINALPTPPSRAEDPAGFSSKADALLGALPQFVTETNATASAVDQVKVDVDLLKTQTDSIRADAIVQTDAIRDDAISQTTALRDTTLGYRNDAQTASGQAAGYRTEAQAYRDGAQAAAAAAGSAAGLPSLVGNARKALIVAPGEDAVAWGVSTQSGYQEFTTSGTWTKPAEATWVYVEAIGGGDGGDGGRAQVAVVSNNASLTELAGKVTPLVAAAKLIRASDLPSNVPVVVGAGGLGGLGQIVPLNAGAPPGVAERNRGYGGAGGVSHFISADFFNSTHSASEFFVAIGYPQAAGGIGASSAMNFSGGNGTYGASAGGKGTRDDTTKAVVAGGAAATGTYTLGGAVTITATNGDDGPDYCGGGGGGGAACQGLPETISNTFVTVRGGDGGSGGYGAPGGHGGNACTAVYTLSGQRINSWIVAQGGDGGDGGNGIVRIWWW